eukprot:305026-Rhodomonas_salina.1
MKARDGGRNQNRENPSVGVSMRVPLVETTSPAARSLLGKQSTVVRLGTLITINFLWLLLDESYSETHRIPVGAYNSWYDLLRCYRASSYY